MPYFKKLIGERLYLSPIDTNDAQKYCEWLNDLEIAKNLTFATQVLTLNAEQQFLDGMAKSSSDVHFAIVDTTNDQLIGGCGFFSVNDQQGTALLGIFIGDKNYHSKGYGSEAIKLLLDFGFNILNLHNVGLDVYSFNQRAIKCYQKVGFREIGRKREARNIGGKRYDIVLMDILSYELESLYLKNILQALS